MDSNIYKQDEYNDYKLAWNLAINFRTQIQARGGLVFQLTAETKDHSASAIPDTEMMSLKYRTEWGVATGQEEFNATRGRVKLSIDKLNEIIEAQNKLWDNLNIGEIETSIRNATAPFTGDSFNWILDTLQDYTDKTNANNLLIIGILRNINKYPTVEEWESFKSDKQQASEEVLAAEEVVISTKASLDKKKMVLIGLAFAIVVGVIVFALKK